jgi:hypothetical protein
MGLKVQPQVRFGYRVEFEHQHRPFPNRPGASGLRISPAFTLKLRSIAASMKVYRRSRPINRPSAFIDLGKADRV